MAHVCTDEMNTLVNKLLEFCKKEGYDLGPMPFALGVDLGGGQSGLSFDVELGGITHSVVITPFAFDGVNE